MRGFGGTPNSRLATTPPGRTTRASSASVAPGSSTYRRRYVTVNASNVAGGERQLLGAPEHERDGQPCGSTDARLQHRRARIQRDDPPPPVGPNEFARDEPGAGRDIEDRGPRSDARDEEPAPARVFAERQQRTHPVVGGPEAREEPTGVPDARRVHPATTPHRGRNGSAVEDHRDPVRPVREDHADAGVSESTVQHVGAVLAAAGPCLEHAPRPMVPCRRSRPTSKGDRSAASSAERRCGTDGVARPSPGVCRRAVRSTARCSRRRVQPVLVPVPVDEGEDLGTSPRGAARGVRRPERHRDDEHDGHRCEEWGAARMHVASGYRPPPAPARDHV